MGSSVFIRVCTQINNPIRIRDNFSFLSEYIYKIIHGKGKNIWHDWVAYFKTFKFIVYTVFIRVFDALFLPFLRCQKREKKKTKMRKYASYGH